MSNRCTFAINLSTITKEDTEILVDLKYITEYQLLEGDRELCPNVDEVVAFFNYFAAGLVIACHDFVHAVMEQYQIQLHEFTPTAFDDLRRFVWAMVSYGGSPDIEVFTRHFILHYQPRRMKLNGVEHDYNDGLHNFKPRRRENCNLMHCSKNKWSSGWADCWFYYKVRGVDVAANDATRTVFPLSYRLVDSNHVTHPSFSSRGSKANEKVYCNVYFYWSSRDFVEEFCAADMLPLAKSFAMPWSKLLKVTFDVEGILGPIFCPTVDLAVRRKNTKKIEWFVRRVEDATARYCGGYSASKHKQILETTATRGRFNRVLHYFGISYPPREVPGEAETMVKKLKRSSSHGCGAAKPLVRKVAARTDPETLPECEASGVGLPRTADARPPSVLMLDVLGESFAPSRDALPRFRSRGRSGDVGCAKTVADVADSGIRPCSFAFILLLSAHRLNLFLVQLQSRTPLLPLRQENVSFHLLALGRFLFQICQIARL